MTAPDQVGYSPLVAFGLRAQAVAFKAKTLQLARGEPETLLEYHSALVPDDTAARLAVIAFCQMVADAPVAAANALLQFLSDWVPRTTADKIEAILRDQAPTQFDWRTRKDSGFD